MTRRLRPCSVALSAVALLAGVVLAACGGSSSALPKSELIGPPTVVLTVPASAHYGATIPIRGGVFNALSVMLYVRTVTHAQVRVRGTMRSLLTYSSWLPFAGLRQASPAGETGSWRFSWHYKMSTPAALAYEFAASPPGKPVAGVGGRVQQR